MDKDRSDGAAERAKASGDAKTEAEGRAEDVAGKARNAVGGAEDGARDVLDTEKV